MLVFSKDSNSRLAAVFRSNLAQGVATGATSFTLDDGAGDLLPTLAGDDSMVLYFGSDTHGEEVVCTGRMGDVLACLPITQDWPYWTAVSARATPYMLSAFVQRLELNELVVFGTGDDADRLSINGTVSGPHLTGPQGTAGVNGAQGVDGSAGADGAPGQNGVNGAPASADLRLTVVKETFPPFCTVPLNVGSVWLDSATYQAPTADIGCADPAYAATLKIVKSDGTVLATVGGSAGGMAWHTASAGFTLANAANVDITLESNHQTAVAIVRGVRIYQ
jgi:hypothetical protein